MRGLPFLSLLLGLALGSTVGDFWPVVLVPGDGGSQVEAKLNKSEVVHYICAKHTSEYFNIWLNLELLMPGIIDCWVDNMKLYYNKTTGVTSNSPGVDIRVPGFGQTETVEWLDPSKALPGAYFKYITEALVAIGFERNLSIRGAPYDFRKAPNENAEFFVKMKALVEETYACNGNKRVILLAHSMGCPMMLYFLNGQSQAWKDTHIRYLITLAGVWGGTVKTLKVFAEGDDLGTHVLSAHTLREEQRSSPSLAWLMPTDKFWKASEVLVQTETRNYTVNDYRDYFSDLGYLVGWYMRKETAKLVYDLVPPGVEVHCLHGVGLPTAEKLVYESGSFPDGSATIQYGDGDGTVNTRSMQGCIRWANQQSQKVYYYTFKNVDHMGILTDANILNYIKKLATSEDNYV